MWFMSEKHTVRVQLACARILRRSSISARDWSRCYEGMSQWGGDVRIGTCSSLGWSSNPRFADERLLSMPLTGVGPISVQSTPQRDHLSPRAPPRLLVA